MLPALGRFTLFEGVAPATCLSVGLANLRWMVDTPARDALVLRFPPGGPDQVTKMRQEAKYAHRHHQKIRAEPWYRLSVWVDSPRPGETQLRLMQRLVRAAGLGRIRIDDERNSVFWWAVAADIYEAGFEFKKDGDPGEAPEHYSVDLGHEPTRETVERFANAFRGPEHTGEMA